MGIEQLCMPPMQWPKELERLATSVTIIIGHYEHGYLEETFKKHPGVGQNYRGLMHQYDKLIDYVKQGYNNRIKEGEYFFNPQARLWLYYEYAIIKGTMGMRLMKVMHNPHNDFFEMDSVRQSFGLIKQHLEEYINPIMTPNLVISGIKTPEQCYRQYLQPIQRAWHRMQKSQGISKKSLELVKHFNYITRLVETLEPDNERGWQFDEKKDEWYHGQRKDILIVHY